MKRMYAVLASVALGLGMSVAAAPSASADIDDCKRGYVCLWKDGKYVNKPPSHKSQGNLEGQVSKPSSASFMYLVNHGVPYPGADHIYYSFTIDGVTRKGCLHYQSDEGNDDVPFSYYAFGDKVTFNYARWGGECPG